jgi:outer membrane protein assembly factor BamD (BamD/ComL family)
MVSWFVSPCFITPCATAFADEGVIKTGTPESEIRKLHAELEQTAQAMRSLPQVAGQPVIGPRKIAAERAWRAAQSFEESGDRVSNIRELTRYLNLVQTGESQRYLVAQRQLAFNYEKAAMPDKAMRAALRYAGSFISQNPATANHDDFIEVLRLVSRLMKNSGPEARAELRQLFAAFTSVDMPGSARMNVLVLAARAAGSTGDLEMARKFLHDPALRGAPSPLDGEVFYLTGIIQAADGKADAAISSLKAAVATFGSSHADRRDRARLALARVQVRKGQNDLAAATYSSIDELSPVYRDALFESVYVLIELGRVDDARDQAAIFKKQFGSADASAKMKLSRMDAWLALKAGDWDGARKAIESQKAVYKEILDFATAELSGGKPVEANAVERIYLKHAGLMDAPDEIEKSWQLSRKLDQQEESLDSDRGEIRQLFMSLGRANLSQINPSWVNTTRALDALVKRHLEAGHRLVGLERNLLLQRLNPAERQELVASENRRNALLGKYPQTLARSEGWRNTADLFENTIRLSAVNDRLMGVEAALGGMRYIENLGDSSGKAPASSPGFASQVGSLRKKMYRTLELVRAQQVENLAETGSHRQLRRLMAFYSMALFDEESVLRRARNEVSDTAERLLFEDFERTWRLWQQVARDSYQQLVSLDKNIREDLGRTVGELWQRDAEISKAGGEILSVRNRMALWVGSRREAILEAVKQRVADRYERLDQWSADMDAMRSDMVKDAARKEALKFDAARQSARDEVVNTQVGGTAVWLD